MDIYPGNKYLASYFLSFIVAGNLKHKDLMGQVVSSQAYLDDQNESVLHHTETIVEDQPANPAE